MKSRICIVSSSRADYGLLKNILRKIQHSKYFDLKFVVTGSHLSKEHGFTINEILSDGIKIEKKVSTIKKTDTNYDISKVISNTIVKMTDLISNIKPDIILLLGDRYEIFATAISASLLNVPIAHVHGGEITEGAIDDVMRHSITKLSHLHFTSTEAYRSRVIQMGEMPKNVYHVGALGVENTKQLKLLTLKNLEKEIDFKFYKKNIIVTYHPVTMDKNPVDGIDVLLKSLEKFPNVGLIFTFANADIQGTYINKKIIEFKKNNSNSVVFSNLGQVKFLSCLKYCDGIVGNSSSGIIEAPSFKTWTLNIGSRQTGRIKSRSIFDINKNQDKITKKLNYLLYKSISLNEDMFINPYYKINTSKNIINILKKYKGKYIIKKKFFDLNFDLNKI